VFLAVLAVALCTDILDSSKRTAVMVDAFPTGIDTALFLEMIKSTRLKDKVIELQRHFDGKSLVLGIDRMDYVKGIPHKLIALEKFLHAYPVWANRIVLVQIATPPKKDTARYQKLRNKVHKLVGRINGRFGTLEHAPIHYLDQPINIIEGFGARTLRKLHCFASISCAPLC
jgi:trehalose-6-phosphate synthase